MSIGVESPDATLGNQILKNAIISAFILVNTAYHVLEPIQATLNPQMGVDIFRKKIQSKTGSYIRQDKSFWWLT